MTTGDRSLLARSAPRSGVSRVDSLSNRRLDASGVADYWSSVRRGGIRRQQWRR